MYAVELAKALSPLPADEDTEEPNSSECDRPNEHTTFLELLRLAAKLTRGEKRKS